MKVLIKNRQRRIRARPGKIRKDALMLLGSFNLDRAELGILFVNDSRMRELNRLYRGKDKTTDVLSFPIYDRLSEIPSEGESLLGDIVINLHAAYRQSSQYGVTLNDEIRRLLIHGFLHLIGFDHERNAYQRKKMTEEEQKLKEALETLG